CGNISNDITQIIYIQDVTAPTFTGVVTEQLLTSTNCVFVAPDLSQLVNNVTVDNCTSAADLTFTQVPAIGDVITQNTQIVVTVADECGNQSQMIVDIRIPETLTLSIVASDVTYCEWDTISLIALPLGGTPAFTYNWTPPTGLDITTDSIVNVYTINQNYDYQLQITDANGCVADASFTLPEPSHIQVTLTEQVPITCFGSADGEILATPANGIPAYTYAWNNGQTTPVASDLVAGNYSVTVTDDYGCTATADFDLLQPTELTATTANITPVLCSGDANGSATVTPTGGTTPYTVSIDNNTTLYPVAAGDTFDFSNLTAGNYLISVLDANLCSFQISFNITTPNLLALTEVTVTMPTCNQASDGIIVVDVAGGTAPFTLSMDGNVVANVQNVGNQQINNISAGIYQFDVVDANGCTAQLTVTMNEPEPIVLQTVAITNVSCNGASDATVEVALTGGTTPYTLWIDNNMQTTTIDAIQNVTFTNLPAGTHTVTVQDVNGCTATLDVQVTEPTVLAVTSANVVDVLCFGDANGEVTITPTGGTAPYTVVVDIQTVTINAGDDNVFTGLTANTYTAFVTDAQGCQAQIDFVINSPQQLTLQEFAVASPLCYQGTDGSITVAVAGGIAPYDVSINGNAVAVLNAAGNQLISNLSQGTYQIDVVDANGCAINISSTVTEPAELILNEVVVTDITCNGGNDGTATVSLTGGTAAFNLFIDNNLQPVTLPDATQTAQFINLLAGQHTVTVTDANNCTATLTVTIQEPAAVSATVDSLSAVLCFGDSTGIAYIDITGGISPYNIVIDPSLNPFLLDTAGHYTFMGLWANAYNAVITDANGCQGNVQFTINQPDTLVADANVTSHVSCFGGNDGEIEVVTTGGSLPYYYNWQIRPQNDSIFEDASAGDYVVHVTDANGCVASDSATVTEPQLLQLNLLSVTPSCNGQPTGVIEVEGVGGTPVYDFQWSNGAITDSVDNLSVGSYSVTVTDQNGCRDTMEIEMPFHEIPNLSVVTTDAFCDRNDGTASVLGDSLNIYTYSWSSAYNPNASVNDQLFAGDYTVSVDDGVCAVTMPFSIGNIPGPHAEFTVNPSVFLQGSADSRFSDLSDGSVVSWLYDFGDGSFSNQQNPFHLFEDEGEYAVVLTVTDENNCIDTAMQPVTVIPNVIIYVPNAFTPTGDGMNDIWMPVLTNMMKNNYLLIVYSRWGEIIFKSNDTNVGWDGTCNGKPAPPEVYTYMIEYYNLMGKKEIKTGIVTLVR
ncbi:MAG TPA: gliding motility-associated C-terminal domain-containing protein, partial [Bacteroidales bacterium]|nr:gliding motility-associated C-terminal domain-containing protein [Bacteroidales bacterium]